MSVSYKQPLALAWVIWRSISSAAQLVIQFPAKYPVLLFRGLLGSSLSLVSMSGRVQKLKQLALKRRPVVNWWVIVPKSACMIHLKLRPSYFGLAYGQTKRKLVGFVLSANTRRNKRNLSIESTQILGRGAYEAYSLRNLRFHCTSIIVKTITEPAVAHAHTFRFLYWHTNTP